MEDDGERGSASSAGRGAMFHVKPWELRVASAEVSHGLSSGTSSPWTLAVRLTNVGFAMA